MAAAMSYLGLGVRSSISSTVRFRPVSLSRTARAKPGMVTRVWTIFPSGATCGVSVYSFREWPTATFFGKLLLGSNSRERCQ